jgi:hypothetical protein
MFAARETASLPQGFDAGLMALRDRRPFPNSPAEVAWNAAQVSDPNYRVEVAEDGLHVYNRDGHHVALDPFELFPEAGVEADGAHAFYLGVELARAQVAHKLGKRYAQGQRAGLGRGDRGAQERPGALRGPGQHAGGRGARGDDGGGGGRRLMPFIRESVVTTLNADGTAHVAPLG